MTAILGVIGTSVPGVGDFPLRCALRAAVGRAGDTVRTHHEFPATLGVADSGRGVPDLALHPPSFAIDEDFVVIADATICHVHDLLRRLDGRVDASASAAELILAAYRASRCACVDYLEGDFAFVVWDRRRRSAFCARDFTGRRPLYLASWRAGLVVASSLDSIAELPGFDAQVDLTAVGADAAGLLFSQDDETCMRGVRSLRAGHFARWSAGDGLVTQRFWQPSLSSTRTLSFDDAARHLRELLVSAVSERSSARGATAVWMSGGRDSTAVFAAGMDSQRRGFMQGTLELVSRSHPPGDSGREDEAIDQIARLWGVNPHWVSSRDTPLFASQAGRTRWSAEPFAPPFEGLTRALARKSVAVGASVALDGYGGDFLFQVSPAYLSDLVAHGRLGRALREWRSMDRGQEGRRGFFRHAMRPLLPRWATGAIAAARGGRALRASMERATPPWISDRFLRQHEILDRFASLGPDAQTATLAADREVQFYLTHQFFARVNAKMAGFALDEGVELRSPLFDRRVVEFALSRPRDERNDAGDQKRLLRAAMRGLLPESVLAPRRMKTGTLATYFAHHMKSEGLRRMEKLDSFAALADVGIIDQKELARAVERYRIEGSAYPFVESLYCTLQAETWLRGRTSRLAAQETEQKLVGAL